MAATPWLLIATGVLIILLAVLALWARKMKKRPTDYYNLFIMGAIWLPIGLVSQNHTFSVIGLIFVLIGLAHKKDWEKNRVKWNDLTPEEKIFRKIVIGALLVVLILGLALFYIGYIGSKSLDSKAKELSGGPNVASVNLCDGYIEVVSSLLGGGSTYYRSDGTTITCLVVGPDSMSPECKVIYEAKLKSRFYCKDVCVKVTDFESCVAAGNPVMESYPRQCSAGGVTYVKKISDVIECKPEQRNAEVCAAMYEPVCAKVNIQCIRAPCNPVEETFSNSCEACMNPLVESYTMGECR